MSETDDTDVLLLIPPDFFLVQSSGSDDSLLESSRTVVHKPQSCTAQVLGKLVNQVHTLESRLESLEVTSVADSSFATLPRRKNWDSDSFDSRGVDRKCYTFPRRRRRKTKRERTQDLSLTSLDSITSRKHVPRLKLNFEIASVDSKATTNESPSMDGDISSIVSTPSKKNDKLLLHEIDEFLTKVEAYEVPDSNDQETLSPESVIKATGDYISEKLDQKNASEDVRLPSGRMVPSSVLDKYIYLVKSNPGSLRSEKPLTSSFKSSYNDELSVPRPPETKDIKPQDTKSPIRKLNFSDKDVQPTSTPKRQTTYLDSFKPSSNKIYDRASKVLEQYKSNYARNQNSVAENSSRVTQNPESSYRDRNTQHHTDVSYRNTQNVEGSYLREDFKMPQMRPYVGDNKDGLRLVSLQNKLMDSIDTDLLSLSELWGERGDRPDRGDSNKLEEERLKREHCELMIQQLQKKILDQQEKLAVAIKVDRAKDAAITKLREAWLRLTSSLDRAEERHRAALEKMCREVDNFKMVANDAQKKTNHFEAELYKALDLAHDYQDKCKHLNTEMNQLRDSTAQALATKDDVVSSKDKEIMVLKENYETVMRLNKQSTDCVKSLEETLEKERSEHDLTRSKSSELIRKLQSTADEVTLLQQEREVLREKVNEERARATLLDRQLAETHNLNGDMVKKCDSLENEVKTLRKHLELQKNELKSHYQKQLEEAVLAKLQEFQHQLDLAEREMENGAREKENAVVDTFNKQISRIEEQHKLEVNVLEEKQREEIKLYRLQLAQASEKIGLLESKLESYRRRRGQIASQLHSVMESQWRQALMILTSGASLTPAPTAPGSLDVTRPDSACPPAAQDYGPPKVPPLAAPPFDKGPGPRDKLFNFEGLSDNELQQYVKLLLTKPPSVGGGGDSTPCLDPPTEEPTSDRPDRERGRAARRSLNVSKPPWKA